MADWYEVREGNEAEHVRASNTRTAFVKGFNLLCGTKYKLSPGYKMTISVVRIRGSSDIAKMLERNYQDSKHKK